MACAHPGSPAFTGECSEADNRGRAAGRLPWGESSHGAETAEWSLSAHSRRSVVPADLPIADTSPMITEVDSGTESLDIVVGQ